MADPLPIIPVQVGPVVVALPAEIDISNASQVRQQLYTALATGAPIVIADMTATTYCDSMGFRALVMAHQQARDGNVELRLVVPPSAYVLRVMAVMSLDTVLRVYPSLDGALAAQPTGNDQEIRADTGAWRSELRNSASGTQTSSPISSTAITRSSSGPQRSCSATVATVPSSRLT
jgi:anti-sigma B factor antagonist